MHINLDLRSLMKTRVAPSVMNPSLPLSPGIIANGFLYVSGFGPQDPVTGEMPEGIAEQTRAVFANLELVLAEAGLDLSDVVKVTAHLQDLKRDFAGYNEMYAELMREPLPVRTTVGSDLMDILVEIDVVAAPRS
jgi:enamine deaminase RidA (YjgF/YER057c/UK114 family)